MTTLIDLVYASSLFFLILFIGLQRFEKRRLINGIVFNFFLFSALMDAALIVIRLNNETLNNIAIAAAIVVVLIVMFFYLFGIVLLLWNAYIVWKKESHTLSNMLTLLIALAIIGSFFIPIITRLLHIPADVKLFVSTIVSVFLLYIPLFFYLYLTSLIIYQFNRPRYQQDYIIVLGSGLIDGQFVPPLLASRINRAIRFYDKQVKKDRPAPKLVFSGG